MSEEESQEPCRVERKLLIRIIPAEIVHPTSFRSNPLSRYDLKCPSWLEHLMTMAQAMGLRVGDFFEE
jgi:hypothetical protein